MNKKIIWAVAIIFIIIAGWFAVKYGGVFLSNISSKQTHIVFNKLVDGKFHVIYDGKDLGEGKGGVASGDSIAFVREIGGASHIIYNGRDMGVGQYPLLPGSNLVFFREINNKTHVIYNGEDIGDVRVLQDYEMSLLENHIALEREINGKIHIIYDGEDLGEGRGPKVSGDGVAFYRVINGKEHIIHNGKDLGDCGDAPFCWFSLFD